MGRNWATIAKTLSEMHRVLILDLQNHRSFPWDDAMDYPIMASDAAKLIETQFDAPVTVIGHSMGSKMTNLLPSS